jgi:hypothetical protein
MNLRPRPKKSKNQRVTQSNSRELSAFHHKGYNDCNDCNTCNDCNACNNCNDCNDCNHLQRL